MPYCENLLDAVSVDILQRYNHLLPNLSDVTVLVPNNAAQEPLREKLMSHVVRYGYKAVLLPACTTLRAWALTKYPVIKPLLSQYARELILVNAINKQSSLFAHVNLWTVANELLSFFDAMALNDVKYLNIQKLSWQCQQNTFSVAALSQEASLIMTLWEAWKQQLADENVLDPVAAYVQALQQSEFSKHEVYYGVGLDKLSECELCWFEKMDAQARLHWFLSASDSKLCTRAESAIKNIFSRAKSVVRWATKQTSPYSEYLDTVFTENELGIKQRANNFASAYPVSPIKSRLKVYKTNSFEHHVKAIDIKIRNCIYANKQNIGVVTSDRKLARRLRAVLEHANVKVNDSGGWALATTSAAVVVESWLRLVEARYPAKQLLALARSPFFTVSAGKEMHDKAISFFEKNIVLAFNLHNGLTLFRNALEQLETRQDDKDDQIFNYLHQLLERFETTTQSLAKLHKQKSIPLHRFFEELINGLKTFGIYAALRKDAAGKQVIDLFESQISHFQKIENEMNWLEWRHFLARILDQQNFRPPLVDSNVTFCSLTQSRLLKFDALIIASVDKNHFPGAAGSYIFFNAQIRSELNITTWLDEQALHFYLFRSLLDAAPEVLITVQNKQNDEKTAPSPWVEAIETFHLMAYGDDLSDKELHTLVTRDDTSIINIQRIPMPSRLLQPSPTLTEHLKPNSISISQYQSLMDCPYQFYATRCLNLSKTDELREELDKASFGSLVHRCIYAFFVDQPSLPGAFTERVTARNRQSAENTLRAISKRIFSRYTEHEFSDQLWLQRWLDLIPNFIDWEIKRQETCTPDKHEASLRKDIDNHISVKGRIDRIDQCNKAYAVVDYKTGQIPATKNVHMGEQVQLPMYASLYDGCTQVEYVVIGKNNTVISASVIQEEELKNLVYSHHVRLREFSNSLKNNARFTAFADDDVCERCSARGLCRKGFWWS